MLNPSPVCMSKDGFTTLGEFASSGLDPMESYKVDMVAEGLKFNPDGLIATASGGERRRVEIARALASRPSFILLDEPFTGIDPIAIADISELVRYLKKRGIGILITDHRVRETLDIVDRASILFQGEALFEGTPDEIRANKDVRRVYLGEKYA